MNTAEGGGDLTPKKPPLATPLFGVVCGLASKLTDDCFLADIGRTNVFTMCFNNFVLLSYLSYVA